MNLTRPVLTLAAASAMTVLGACASMSGTAMKAPDVPAAIAVPAGNKVAMSVVGKGLINYECRAKAATPGAFEWVLVSPEAMLVEPNGTLIGKYYGGPTWEHGDGSKFTGKQLAVTPPPTPGNIPWQLVQANPAMGAGNFSGVTYVQRVNTNGGVAPAETCDTASAGAKRQVKYSADYVFFKAA